MKKFIELRLGIRKDCIWQPANKILISIDSILRVVDNGENQGTTIVTTSGSFVCFESYLTVFSFITLNNK